MSDVLAEYNSKSYPDKKYHIIKGKDGKIYCDCWQWKTRRTCAHLKHYNSIVLPAIKYGHQVGIDKDCDLEVAIKAAVESLR